MKEMLAATPIFGTFEMQLRRRQFVLGVISGCAIVALPVGCTDNRASEEAKKQAEVSLTFSETDEFYDRLSKAIESKQNIVLTFDGKHHVDKNSKLLNEFICKASNCEELWNILKQKDTEAGRKELAWVFAADLLNHKALKDHPEAVNGVTLPSGEVIAPAVVILALGIALILAAASVAHAESARGRKYRISIREPRSGLELYFQGEQ